MDSRTRLFLLGLCALVGWLPTAGCNAGGGTNSLIGPQPDGGTLSDTPEADIVEPDVPPPPDCDTSHVTATADGLFATNDCGASLRLWPRVLFDGAWLGGGDDGACALDQDGALSCPAGAAGTVVARAGPSGVRISLQAAGDGIVGGFELRGEAVLPGATAWLSNGFQSWSQSGVIALGDAPAAEALAEAVGLEGDAEVIRSGETHSWWHTLVGGGSAALLAGAASAVRFRSWAQVSTAAGGNVALRLVSGAVASDQVTVAAGQTLAGEAWFVAISEDLELLRKGYGAALLSRRRLVQAPADVGWNSWYELWDTVDQAAVLENAPLASQILEAYLPAEHPPLRIVIDDGWQQMWGEWEPNDKFPLGLDGVAAELHAQGYEVGVWLAPLLVDADSALVADHPEWFVTGASFHHLTNGSMRILDPTHPGARAHLQEVIARIVGWGYDFLKIDFLFAGTFHGARAQPVTGIEAYHQALAAIREAAGEDTVLLAVGAPALPSLPWVDAWRVGGDIAVVVFGASWPFIPSQARSLAARWSICLATLCDADPPLLRTLPRNEVETGAWVVAFSGGGVFLSDDLRELPAERFGWGLDTHTVALGAGGVPAVPLDMFPPEPPQALENANVEAIYGTNDQVVPTLWRTPDGGFVALNTSDEPLDVDGQTVPARSAAVISQP